MNTVKLFVEGGGKSNSLHCECRAAFRLFLEKTGLTGHMPRIVACGSRDDAYSDFCTAVINGERAILLVDSEGPVIAPPGISSDPRTWKPWYHLKHRMGQNEQPADNWDMPEGASDTDCHLMVMLMESWFLADVDALKRYYGQGFNENCFPARNCIEEISKDDIIMSLANATRGTQKGTYDKGRHSFKLLAQIDPDRIVNRSPWAKRFIVLLSEKMLENV